MSSHNIIDLSMTNSDIIMQSIVPTIAIITAVTSLFISKKHIYSRALILISVALFTIAIGWLLPIIPQLTFDTAACVAVH